MDIILPASSQRKAFSLIEAAIVLGIVGLVIGGIWVAASAVTAKRKEARFIEQMEHITARIRENFPDALAEASSNVLFVDFAMTGAIRKAGWGFVIPPDMISNAAAEVAPLTPWGTTISISIERPSVSVNTVPYPIYYNITLPNRGVCVSLAPKLANIFKTERNLRVTNQSDVSVATPALASANCTTNLYVLFTH